MNVVPNLARLGLLLFWLPAQGQTPPPLPADTWVTTAVQFPPGIATNTVRTNGFETLHAEVVARRVKIVWPNEAIPATAEIILMASADDAGHWPARDWRTYPMTKRG